jgi:hypothetical protein
MIRGASSLRFAVLLLLLLAGCGKSRDALVSGSVTLDGEPLKTGTVTFHPLEGGPAAYGQIGSDGSFSLKTGRQRGIDPGDYVATVVAATPPSEQNGLEMPGELLTPERYGQVKQTDLRFTVRPGNNRFDLPLKSN